MRKTWCFGITIFVVMIVFQQDSVGQLEPSAGLAEVLNKAAQALDTYERSAVAMETSSGVKLHKDRRLLASARQLLDQLRKNPASMNSAAAVYLLQGLNEAGRNLSVNSHILLRNAISQATAGNTAQSNMDMTRAESLQNAGEILYEASSGLGRAVARSLQSGSASLRHDPE